MSPRNHPHLKFWQQIARVGDFSNFSAPFVRVSPPILTTLIISLLVVGSEKLRFLEPLELRLFDALVCLRPQTKPDPNLLVVAITEDDIQSHKKWPMTDQLLAQVFEKLQQHQPTVIGLDLYRDLPQEPGGKALLKQLQADNVIAITKIGNSQGSSVSAPPGVPPERIGFNDLVLDADGVVRRQLLFASGQDQKTIFAFSLQLALAFLQTQGIEPQNYAQNSDYMELGESVFFPLRSGDGGYADIDNRGYQILMNYRTENVARVVTISDILSEKVNPKWIKNKIILIGTTAPSIPDAFLTPYSITATENFKMPGVLIHAQMVSQIINAAQFHRLIKTPASSQQTRLLSYPNLTFSSPDLFRFLPEGLEIVWIGTWAMIGGALAWKIQHPLQQGLALLIGFLSLFGVGYGLFLLNIWVPILAPMLSLALAGTGIIGYKQVYNSLHDSLTGLPNRSLFLDRVGRAITQSKSHPEQCAVLFINIDRFKRINDSLGQQAGDELLLEMVQRLKTALRNHDQIARLGGDEFAILIENLNTRQNAILVAERIHQALLLPFTLNQHDVFMTLSIGIALSETAEGRAEYLLRNAHTALYRARGLSKGLYQVFEQSMQVNNIEQLKLETSLRLAIERQEFILYYQPVISLASGKIAGFEALIRWEHPDQGLLTPDVFMAVAKETGLIVPMGKWALQEACSQLKVWQDKFTPELELILGVNLSARQFYQADLVEQIHEMIQLSEIDPNGLRLEITESVVMDDLEETIHLLNQLRNLGIKLSIDDFGTGFSSLSYLPRFPINTIKVDQSFVGQIGRDQGEENLTIVRTIIRLAHGLNKDVVAEGVETAYQLEQLRSLNCEYAQGYYFLKPVPADIAAAFVESNPQW